MPASQGTVMVDKEDFARLEEKVDILTNAIGKLILFEDRQARMGERLGEQEKAIVGNYNELKTRIDSDKNELQNKLMVQQLQISRWTNMMIGGWGVFSFVLMIAMWVYPLVHGK